MDMGTVGWIAIGWFAVALVMSLALGSFLRKANEISGDDDFALAASKGKITYMRGRKPASARVNIVVPRIREMGKRATG